MEASSARAPELAMSSMHFVSSARASLFAASACPIYALGEGRARGEIGVAGEYAASHAVHRRLAAAFEAAGGRSRGSVVMVGTPSGSQHELGALDFATAIRWRGWMCCTWERMCSWATGRARCVATRGEQPSWLSSPRRIVLRHVHWARGSRRPSTIPVAVRRDA